jgi:hypothetical protein
MDAESRQDLANCIEIIESGYEYMLAYAAQGRSQENSGGDGPGIRGFLENINSAIGALPDAFRACVPPDAGPQHDAATAFFDIIEADSFRARGAIQFVLAVPAISSRVVDNLNASVHVRTLLTDLFLADEALKSTGKDSG